MTLIDLIIITAVISILICAYTSFHAYSVLIKKQKKVQEYSESLEIDIENRYNAIENILKKLESYSDYEKLCEDFYTLRKNFYNCGFAPGSYVLKMSVDNKISLLINPVLKSFDNKPNLAADETIAQAVENYKHIQSSYAVSKARYNEAVKNLRNTADKFPYKIFSSSIKINE